MNFTQLQDRVKFVLNNNDSQTDQDFSNTRIKQALNYAYEDEINQATEEGGRRYFKTTQTFTWPKSQKTYELSFPLTDRGLIRMVDITTTDPGYNIVFSDKGFDGDVFWKDRKTLQWGTSGPGADKTLRVEYFAVAEELSEDDDEPELIPPQFRWLLVWTAAIFLRDVADEQSPQKWLSNASKWRIDFVKYVSRGRPADDVPTVTNSYPDSEVGFVY